MSRQSLNTEVASNIALDPTGQLWWQHMLAGNFEAAWQINDARRLASVPDPHRMWDGSPIHGRHLMLRCLHGLGDAVQLLRYAPLLRALAASLTVEVPPALVDLALCFPSIDHVITWGEQALVTPPAWDLQIEINELPYLFRTTLATIPLTPCLHLPPSAREQARAALAPIPHPRIGLAWQSSAWNPARSLPMPLLREALRGIPAHLVSLQTPADEAASGWTDAVQTAAMCTDPTLHTANICGPGLLPLACAIAHLDLVITVDTLAAHLAGALGRPTCLLLQHHADWRWLSTRPDSPWYPTLRLYRQPASRFPGDSAPPSSAWAPVLHHLRADLLNWTALKR